MKFQIDYNRKQDDKTLEQIGAKLIQHEEYNQYEIELNTFEELKELLDKVNIIENTFYSALISFDSPTIYLDKDL